MASKFKNLTALRAAEALEYTSDSSDYRWRYEYLRGVIREHVKYHITKPKRRSQK